MVIDEPFEFAIRTARTVKISASARGADGVPDSSTVQIPKDRIQSP